MSESLLGAMRSFVTPELISTASGALGETPGAIRTGMDALLPALLGGAVQKSTDTDAMGRLLGLAKDVPAGIDPAPLLTEADGESGTPLGAGQRALGLLFGERGGSILGLISRMSGLRESATASLMSMVSTLLLSVINERATTGRMDGVDLGAWLMTQRDQVLAALPSALGGLMGMAAPTPPEAIRTPATPGRIPAGRRPTSGTPGWLGPGLVGLIVLCGVWMFSQSPRLPTPNPPATRSPAAAAVHPAALALESPADNGIEKRLLQFLGNASQPVDRATWFDFDRVSFERGSDQLKTESAEQITNLVQILLAYPNVKVKVGGYTDDRKLSAARAEAVKRELVRRGIDGSRIETVAGLAKESRVALRVVSP